MLEKNVRIQHEGDPPFDIVVRIDHMIMSDNSHAFTAKDIPGLLVIHKDLKTCIKQLPVVIKNLLLKNKNIDCRVTLGADDPTDITPEFAIIRDAA